MADQVGQSGLLTESRLLAKIESGGFCTGDQERLLRMQVISNVATARDIYMLDEQGGPDDRNGVTFGGAVGQIVAVIDPRGELMAARVADQQHVSAGAPVLAAQTGVVTVVGMVQGAHGFLHRAVG